MKEMIKRMREEKGGFTLAELLIVVAIVLVLVAIAVPVFTGALDRAEDAVEQGNIRAVKAAAGAAIVLDEGYTTSANTTWTATATVNSEGTVDIESIVEGGNADSESTADKNDDGGYDVTAYITETDLPEIG